MTVKVNCVHCGTPVHEFTVECPNCKKPVADRDAQVSSSEPPWKMKRINYAKKFPTIPVVIGVIIVIAAAASAVFFLMFK